MITRTMIALQFGVAVSYIAVIAGTIILYLQVETLMPQLQAHPQAEGIAAAAPLLFCILGFYFTTRIWWSVIIRRLK